LNNNRLKNYFAWPLLPPVGYNGDMSLRRILLCLLLLFFLDSCGGERGPPPEGSGGTIEIPSSPEALLAVLRPGPNPLWFDASDASSNRPPEDAAAGMAENAGDGTALEGAPAERLAGLRLIDSPTQAELAPFTPWPLAPHAAALLVHRGIVYLALNRDSLLAFLPLEGGDLGLYRFEGTDYWESYTVGSLFLYDDKPALFFYRDDIFTDPVAPPPDPPVLTLLSRVLAGGTGTADSALLEGKLEALEIPALAGIPLAEGWEADILRPGADGLWYYRAFRRKNGGREIRYFRTADLSRQGEEIDPGLYRNSQRGEAVEPDLSGLPPLPEDFSYTHVIRLEDLIIASWEEQRDYNIGAAGFMVVRKGEGNSVYGGRDENKTH
jgi:hypothetical protein